MKMKKIFIIILSIYLIFAMSTSGVYAKKGSSQQQSSGGKFGEVSQVISDMDGVQAGDTTDDGGVVEVLNDVIGLLQLAGTGIAVITVTLLGAKYMLSSVEQKAEIKNKAIPVVIGCVILFSAVNLVAIVSNFAIDALSNNNSSNGGK